MRRHLPLTDAQKRAAWAALARQRADFPQTYDAAMAAPMPRALVRIEALQAAQRQARAAAAPAHRPLLGQRHFDAKRAAAGERDD